LKRDLDPAKYAEFLKQGLLRREPRVIADDSKLASGPPVGKSTHFAKWLGGHDRKFAALEMESAGVYSQVDLTRKHVQPKTLAIRGISDFADERKSQVEKSSKGVLRAYCMTNAASLLKLAIEGGLCGAAADGKEGR
jgi:hypothetical protein